MAKAEKTAQPFTVFENLSTGQSEAMKKGMERFMALTGDFGTLSREGMEALAESTRASVRNAQDINQRAATYLQGAMADGMETSKSIASAKSLQEAMEIQTAYAKRATQAYMEEANTFFGLMSAAMRESVEPLNAQTGKVVEKFQSAS